MPDRIRPRAVVTPASTPPAPRASVSSPGEAWQQYKRDALHDGRLAETSYRAHRSDGRQVTVNGVLTFPSDDFRPHMLREGLKLLRNAYAADPAHYRDELFNELDFVFSHAVDRSGSLVLENANGFADGMVQTEYADLMLSIAQTANRVGDAKLCDWSTRTAVRLLQSLSKPDGARTGGFRTDTVDAGPPNARAKAAFFHSRAGATHKESGTALNQTLHVLRDSANLTLTLRNWSAPWPVELPAPQELAKTTEQAVVSGLYQLAFAPDSKSSGFRNAPNLSQYVERRGDVSTSFYEFDSARQTGVDITAKNTAHYHFHTLELFDQLFTTLDSNRFDRRALIAKDALLQGPVLRDWYTVATDPAAAAKAGSSFAATPKVALPYLDKAFGSR